MGLVSSSYILCSSHSSWPSRLALAGTDTLPQEGRSGLMELLEDSSHMFCYGHFSMGWCMSSMYHSHFTVGILSVVIILLGLYYLYYITIGEVC